MSFPYGWNFEYEHVDGIQRQALVDFYHRYYFPATSWWLFTATSRRQKCGAESSPIRGLAIRAAARTGLCQVRI